MTRENKLRLLQAFDILMNIQEKFRDGAGGYVLCGECGSMLSTTLNHADDCDVGFAITILNVKIPTYQQREKWLSE